MPLGKREKGLGIEKGISCRVCCYNVTLWDLQKHLIFLHKSESFFQLFLLLIKKKKPPYPTEMKSWLMEESKKSVVMWSFSCQSDSSGSSLTFPAVETTPVGWPLLLSTCSSSMAMGGSHRFWPLGRPVVCPCKAACFGSDSIADSLAEPFQTRSS